MTSLPHHSSSIVAEQTLLDIDAEAERGDLEDATRNTLRAAAAEIRRLSKELADAKDLLSDVKLHTFPFLNLSAASEIDYQRVRITCDRVRSTLTSKATL